MKIQHLHQLMEVVSEEEWIILEVLRGIIKDRLPDYCKEKIAYNVPFFYGNKGIAIVWPASIPRGGIKEGVLLGFWQGNKLKDAENYLTKGTNKKVFYRIFKSVEEIEVKKIERLIDEAIIIDQMR